VIVDTDLGGNDLVALAFLLRHPAVRVEAVTIAATGLAAGIPLTVVPEDAIPTGTPDALDEEYGRAFLSQ
jgi:hypothetical protein